MIYEIQEISTDADSGYTYVLVHFWDAQADKDASKPPALVEEFLMQLQPTGNRVFRNAQGQLKLQDGSFIDPSESKVLREVPVFDPETRELLRTVMRYVLRDDLEREDYTRDLQAEIEGNIEAFMAKAEARGWRGDRRRKISPVVRNQSDPKGVLSHVAVASMRQKIAQRRASR